MPPKVYLDANGNPTTAPVYLDDYGNPITPKDDAPQEGMASRMGGAFLRTVGNTLNPMSYMRAAQAKDAADFEPLDQRMARERAQGEADPYGAGTATDTMRHLATPEGAGAVLGNVATAALVPMAVRAGGRLIMKAAGPMMDMGLQRTSAERLKFPNAPQRLVDEGIVPRGQNVQRALTATEQKVQAEAAAFDAANPGGAVDPNLIAGSANNFAHTEGKVGGLGNVPGQEAAEIDALMQEYLTQNTRPRTLGETIDQKRAYQARASYSSRPNAPTVTNNRLNFNEGVADANRSEAIRHNPALEADLAKEQDLLGALTAQKFLESKSMPLSTVGTLKTLVGLRNPTVMGTAAIATDRLGRGMQVLAPAVRAALLARLMASHRRQE